MEEEEEDSCSNYNDVVVTLNTGDSGDHVSLCTCCVFYLLAHLTD